MRPLSHLHHPWLIGFTYVLVYVGCRVPICMAQTPGPAGYALEFDGNDWASYNSNETDYRPNRFTTEAWVHRRFRSQPDPEDY